MPKNRGLTRVGDLGPLRQLNRETHPLAVDSVGIGIYIVYSDHTDTHAVQQSPHDGGGGPAVLTCITPNLQEGRGHWWRSAWV